MIELTHYMRSAVQRGHSIESLFADVRSQLPTDIRTTVVFSKYRSSGLFKRIFNVFRTWFQQGNVNHVTGDVHFLVLLLKPGKTILTIHDCVMMEYLLGFERWLFWLFWLWLPVKRCTAVTVISEATRQQVLKYVKCDPNKVKVIQNHVSDAFKPVPNVFNHRCPRILQVGTTPNKNINRIAASLTGLQCKVVVIGDLTASQLQALTLHRIDYEQLQNLSLEALVSQYVECDLLIFASLYEGFGLPIVEANAVGRPVVTSNVWSMPEVAGNAACLVDPLDVDSIRAGVVRVINDEAYRDELVANGLENVKRFQLKAIAAQYADLYRQVYEQSKR